MKFKIDQNLPLEFEEILAGCGHDAISVHRQGMNGAPDEKVVEVCLAEDRALITADLDLSDIRAYPPGQSAGYIVFRLKKQSRPRQIALLKELLPLLDQQPLGGKLWIVERNKLRVRG
jgi:predicted nuclease of predicted toxin-antitoxin system